MRARLAHAVAPLVLAFASPAAAQVGNDAAFDATRAAIELEPHSAALDLASIGDRLGVPVERAELYGPRTHRLLVLAGALSAAERDERLRSVAELPGVRFASPVWSGETLLPEFPTRHVLARFEAGVPESEQRAAFDAVGLEVERERFGDMENAWRLVSGASTGDGVVAQARALRSFPGVRWSHPDRVLGHELHDVIPTDPLFPSTWGLQNTGQSVSGTSGTPGIDLNATKAWDITQGSPSVRVVVLDNGVEMTHPDLNLAGAADFTGSGSGGGPPVNNACHGTAVAGCVSSRINNALGTSGIAPACSVLSAAVSVPNGLVACDQGNAGMASWKVDALSWAQLSGARVSNWSFSMSSDDAVKDMLVETRNHGMVHFSSSGNSFPVPIAFPANFHAVHAIGSDGQKASGSQTGGTLAFAAPGVSIQTTDRLGVDGYNPALSPNGDYSIASGTSFASPYAAGVAALVLSIQPSLSAHDVWVALVASARELGTPGWDSSFGHGLLNARGALVVATEMAPGYAIVDPIAPDPPAAYGTIAAAVAAVPAGGLVLPIPTSYPEALVMKRPLLLRTWGTLPTVIGE